MPESTEVDYHPALSEDTFRDLATLLADPRRIKRRRDDRLEFGYEDLHVWQARNVQDWLNARDEKSFALVLKHVNDALGMEIKDPDLRKRVHNTLIYGDPEGSAEKALARWT